MTDREPCVLAVDPGSAKCGLAVVRRSGEVLFRGIVATERAVAEVCDLIARYQPVALLLGDGTGSKPLLRALRAAPIAVPLTLVDEAHTSEAAQTRYVTENPARGWQRLLPRSLRVPDAPYDDYVAILLAERYWSAIQPSPPGPLSHAAGEGEDQKLR